MALNLNRLRDAAQSTRKEDNLGIGQGLLSNVSKSQAAIPDSEKVNLKKIALDKIKCNPRNGYSQQEEEIENLAESIYTIGQLEPISVLESSEGDYLLVSGEKRYRAVTMLYEHELHSNYIDAYVKSLDDINLPLSNEMKEELLIVAPNAERRNNTEYDTMMEIDRLNKIYTELRNAGYEEILGHRIAGVKNRSIISDTLKISEGKVHQYQTVQKSGTEALHNRMKETENGLSVNMASQIATMSPNDQEEFLRDTEGDIITPQKIQDFKEKKEDKKEVETDQPEPRPVNLYTISDWKIETKPITKLLKNGISLDSGDRNALNNAVDVIKKIIRKNVEGE